ncbi:glycosyltransferase family 2 protein [Mesorhizobium sp. 1B3]|uniref:glycosyltransferase family 2 protein n=1 Tax=Mesorhizobium sp. 1B3 TaxID=3243599 RepID=UPI003D9920FE
MNERPVCVIIAVRNGANTIGTAISSALREPEVGEVIVVDDASTDGTQRSAMSADDGSGRLRLIRFDENRGPAQARNVAIESSPLPFVSILDADDVFVRGRFTSLLGKHDWDLIADNIVFVSDDNRDLIDLQVPPFRPNPRFLGLTEFVAGNISRPGLQRGELGFLKPVMRRAFLERFGLRYDPLLRLGEDYDLYTRALAAGARFKLVDTCGYGALVRPDSLSGRHHTDDLKRLAEADRSILALPDLPASARTELRRHQRHVRDKYRLRNFLDIKARGGMLDAALHGLRHPHELPAIVTGIARDKLGTKPRRQPSARTVRYLLRGELGPA